MYHSRVALNRRQITCLIRFSILIVGFYTLVLLKPVDRAVVTPYTKAITAASAAVLNALGENVHRSGTLISGRLFVVDIKNGCNGIEAMVFIIAAMIAFDAPMMQRLIGIGTGALAIQLLNLIRIVTLYWIGAHRRAWFETFHLAIWQTVIFISAILVFLWWTSRVQQINAADAS